MEINQGFAAAAGQISPEGLMFYLMGSETSVVKLDKLAQSHDMTQPIPHYFVKSSHNTYLTGEDKPTHERFTDFTSELLLWLFLTFYNPRYYPIYDN